MAELKVLKLECNIYFFFNVKLFSSYRNIVTIPVVFLDLKLHIHISRGTLFFIKFRIHKLVFQYQHACYSAGPSLQISTFIVDSGFNLVYLMTGQALLIII